MLRLALSNVGKTFANEGNLNNFIGVPLSLSRVSSDKQLRFSQVTRRERNTG